MFGVRAAFLVKYIDQKHFSCAECSTEFQVPTNDLSNEEPCETLFGHIEANHFLPTFFLK